MSLTTRVPMLMMGAALLLPPPAMAHDFWLEPSTFAPPADGLVRLHLRIGHAPRGEPVIRDKSLIDRFVTVGPEGEREVGGLDGHAPAGIMRVGKPGVHVVGYQSRPAPIELQPALFEAYLRQEGLEDILAGRATRGEAGQPGRERFSRCAKTILSVANGRAEGYDRRLGFTLELIPLRDPTRSDNQPVAIQALYRGKPCPGIQVVAVHSDPLASPLTARTDENGEVELDLKRGGMWVMKAVYMVRLPTEADADWESFWASLTFERAANDGREQSQDRISSSNSPMAGHRTGRTGSAWTALLGQPSHPPAPRRSGPATRPAQ